MVHIDFGLQPRAVLSVDQEPRFTTLLGEIKAKRAEALVERTVVESEQSGSLQLLADWKKKESQVRQHAN